MSFANQQSGIGCKKYAYLYNEEKSKKKLICKNGYVFPDECSEHGKQCKGGKGECNSCGCVEKCNRFICKNGKTIYRNGCKCNCKKDCRDRQSCMSGKYLVQ